jgi:hypothetical protein
MVNTGFPEIKIERLNYNGTIPWFIEVAITGNCNFNCKYCNRFCEDINLETLVKHIQISRPYSVLPDGSEMNTAKLSDENGKGIVDSSEQQYISTREYEKNMGLLIRYLKR